MLLTSRFWIELFVWCVGRWARNFWRSPKGSYDWIFCVKLYNTWPVYSWLMMGNNFIFFPMFLLKHCFFIGGRRHFWNLFKTSPKFWGWKQFFGKYAGYWETPCFHGFLPESPPGLIKWYFESIPCRMRGYYFMAQLSEVTYGLLQWLSSHFFTTEHWLAEA